jgi:hypothetical protein
MTLHISDDLTRWAAMAGYSLTPEDRSGAALFWSNPGGETRFYIRSPAKGVYIVSSAQRASAEQFELYGTSMKVIERFLFGIFGADVRALRMLARLVTSTKDGQLAPGFSLDEPDAEGFACLRDLNGLAAKAQGRVNSISTLTKLSHLLCSTLPEIRASFEDPEGRPLFAIRK